MAQDKGVVVFGRCGRCHWGSGRKALRQGRYKVCVARRDAAKSQGLVDELKAEGCEVHAISVDARQEADVQAMFARIEKEIGPIEVCLYNAGSNVNKPLLGNHREAVLQGLGIGLLTADSWSAGKPPSIWCLAAMAPSCSPGATGERARRQRLRGLRIRQVRPPRRGAIYGPRLGPKNIHVLHLLIDAAVDSEAIHQRMKARRASRRATSRRTA